MSEEPTTTISTSWHSYPSSYALGHRLVLEILQDEVFVEEKVDGSQFSFGVFNGELRARSKGAVLNLLAPEKMFTQIVDVIKEMNAAGLLRDGWTYRGEYLKVPKHNALAYDRIPNKHFIGFDINSGHETYLSYEEKVDEFARLGFETVPLLHRGRIEGYEMFREFLETISVLGGQKIEGVVIKNYSRFGLDKKILMAKFVSEAFKEVHSASWKEANPGQKDVLEIIKDQYRTPARWAKAVQHLREAGQLQNAPQDIPLLLKEVASDIHKEAADAIKEDLFKWAWPKISRGVIVGLPQWYKDELAKAAFDPGPVVVCTVVEADAPEPTGVVAA